MLSLLLDFYHKVEAKRLIELLTPKTPAVHYFNFDNISCPLLFKLNENETIYWINKEKYEELKKKYNNIEYRFLLNGKPAWQIKISEKEWKLRERKWFLFGNNYTISDANDMDILYIYEGERIDEIIDKVKEKYKKYKTLTIIIEKEDEKNFPSKQVADGKKFYWNPKKEERDDTYPSFLIKNDNPAEVINGKVELKVNPNVKYLGEAEKKNSATLKEESILAKNNSLELKEVSERNNVYLLTYRIDNGKETNCVEEDNKNYIKEIKDYFTPSLKPIIEYYVGSNGEESDEINNDEENVFDMNKYIEDFVKNSVQELEKEGRWDSSLAKKKEKKFEKILFLTAEDDNLKDHIDKERKILTKIFKEDYKELELKNILKEKNLSEYDIILYSGHCLEDGTMEDKENNRITAEQLKEKLKENFEGILVLNTCFAENIAQIMCKKNQLSIDWFNNFLVHYSEDPGNTYIPLKQDLKNIARKELFVNKAFWSFVLYKIFYMYEGREHLLDSYYSIKNKEGNYFHILPLSIGRLHAEGAIDVFFEKMIDKKRKELDQEQKKRLLKDLYDSYLLYYNKERLFNYDRFKVLLEKPKPHEPEELMGENEELKDGIYAFKVGKGDSTLLYYKGDSILIDGGDKPINMLKTLYNSSNLNNLNLAVLTHGDLDHLRGLSELFNLIKNQKFNSKGVEKLIAVGIPIPTRGFKHQEELVTLGYKIGAGLPVVTIEDNLIPIPKDSFGIILFKNWSGYIELENISEYFILEVKKVEIKQSQKEKAKKKIDIKEFTGTYVFKSLKESEGTVRLEMNKNKESKIEIIDMNKSFQTKLFHGNNDNNNNRIEVWGVCPTRQDYINAISLILEKKEKTIKYCNERKLDEKYYLTKYERNTYSLTDINELGIAVVILIRDENDSIKWSGLFTGDTSSISILEGLENLEKEEGIALNKKHNKYYFDYADFPHHGSKKNIPRLFMEKITSKIMMISTNGDSYGHPDYITLQIINAFKSAETKFYITELDKVKDKKSDNGNDLENWKKYKSELIAKLEKDKSEYEEVLEKLKKDVSTLEILNSFEDNDHVRYIHIPINFNEVKKEE